MNNKMDNKTNYLQELQKHLLWHNRPEEIREILNDYAVFFEEGVQKGKSEQEICEELGTPSLAAKNLRQESNYSENTRLFTRKALLGLLLAIFSTILLPFILFPGYRFLIRPDNLFIAVLPLYLPILAYCIWAISRQNLGTRILGAAFLWVESLYLLLRANEHSVFILLLSGLIPLLLFMLWALLGGQHFSLDMFFNSPTKKQKREFWLAHFILFLSACLSFGASFFTFYAVDHAVPFLSNDLALYGPILRFIFYILLFAAAVLAVWGIYHYRISSIYYSVFCHAFGTIGMISSLNSLLGGLDTPSSFLSSLLQCPILYAEGLLLAAGILLYVRYTGRM